MASFHTISLLAGLMSFVCIEQALAMEDDGEVITSHALHAAPAQKKDEEVDLAAAIQRMTEALRAKVNSDGTVTLFTGITITKKEAEDLALWFDSVS